MNHYSNRLNYYQDSLSRFIQSDRPIMLILGQLGSGKSQLIDQFCQNIAPAQRALKLDGNDNLTPADITTKLAQHWNLNLDPQQDSQRKQIDSLISQLQKKHSSNLLIINNAHLLSIPASAAICHLESIQATPPVCLHIILTGEVNLEEKITSLMTSSPPSLLLQPLTQKETFQYIKDKLQKLNHTPPNVEALQKIYENSGGFPSLVNHLIRCWIAEENHKPKIAKKRRASDLPASPSLQKPRTTTQPKKNPHLQKIIAATCLMLIGVGYLAYHHTHHPIAKIQQVAHLGK